MKRYEIWVEGYAATGEHGTAQKITTHRGLSFADACRRAHERGRFEGYGEFDPEKLTLWGCHLHPNERDARQDFG